MTAALTSGDVRRKARMAVILRAPRRTTDVNPGARSVSVEKAGWWSERLGVPVPPGTPTAALPKSAEIDDVLAMSPEQRSGYLKLRAAGGTHARALKDAGGLSTRKATKAPAKKSAKTTLTAPSEPAKTSLSEMSAEQSARAAREGRVDPADAAKHIRAQADEAERAAERLRMPDDGPPDRPTGRQRSVPVTEEGRRDAAARIDADAARLRRLADRVSPRPKATKAPAKKAPAKKASPLRDGIREQGERDARRETGERESRQRESAAALSQSHTREALAERQSAAKKAAPSRSSSFDDSKARTYKSTGAPKRAERRDGPATIQAEWGEEQRFTGPWYAVLDDDGKVKYGAAAKEWESDNEQIPGQPGQWRKVADVQAYQHRGAPRRVETVLADGTSETSNTANDGDWIVKQRNGEVQVIPDGDFRQRYDVGSAPAKAAPAKKATPSKAPSTSNAAYDTRVARLERVATGKPTGSRRLSGGVSSAVTLETHEGGQQLIRKDYAESKPGAVRRKSGVDAAAELLAPQVMEAFGVRAAATAPGGHRDEVLQEFIPGESFVERFGDPSKFREDERLQHEARIRKLAEYLDTPEGRRLGLADYVMGNSDRSAGNFIITPDGIVAIDHGQAFWDQDGTRFPGSGAGFSEYLRDDFGLRGSIPEFTPDEMRQFRERLEGLEPEFRAAGHAAWYRATLRRLREVEKRVIAAHPAKRASPSRDEAGSPVLREARKATPAKATPPRAAASERRPSDIQGAERKTLADDVVRQYEAARTHGRSHTLAVQEVAGGLSYPNRDGRRDLTEVGARTLVRDLLRERGVDIGARTPAKATPPAKATTPRQTTATPSLDPRDVKPGTVVTALVGDSERRFRIGEKVETLDGTWTGSYEAQPLDGGKSMFVRADQIVTAPTPRKATGRTPRADFDAASLVTELRGDWSNPPSREETAAKLDGLSKPQLLAIARELGVPRAASLNQQQLRAEIVQATVGRRLDSMSTRGFRGERPEATANLDRYREAREAGIPDPSAYAVLSTDDRAAYRRWLADNPGGSVASWRAAQRREAFDPEAVAQGLERDVDLFMLSSSATAAAQRQAEGEAGIRQALAGLNLTQLRRVASQWRFSGRPPTGVTSAQFVDWMLEQWRRDRGRWSLQ